MAGKVYYDWKKKFKPSVWRVVLLCQFLVLAITTGKKSSSRLSGGLCCCVSFWFWREIGSFFVVAGKFYYNRKKKCSSCLSGRLCCCVSFVITTGKKSSSHLSGGCAIVITTRKKSYSHVFYAKLNVSNLNVTNLY